MAPDFGCRIGVVGRDEVRGVKIPVGTVNDAAKDDDARQNLKASGARGIRFFCGFVDDLRWFRIHFFPLQTFPVSMRNQSFYAETGLEMKFISGMNFCKLYYAVHFM